MTDQTPTAAPETPGTVIGNHCYKYTTSNPAIRWLTGRFLARLDALTDAVVDSAAPDRVLEVGCGEGEIADRLARRFDDVTALDLPDAGLRTAWQAIGDPQFLHADAERLPFADGAFDLVVCVEVLEHLADPRAGLAELARVSGRDLILSVPREPIFRMGNLATGRHLRSLGNTPGHLNHWSTPAFVRFVSSVARIRMVAQPFPWTIVWARANDR